MFLQENDCYNVPWNIYWIRRDLKTGRCDRSNLDVTMDCCISEVNDVLWWTHA